jgi:hypothetical protein
MPGSPQGDILFSYQTSRGSGKIALRPHFNYLSGLLDSDFDCEHRLSKR